MPPNYCRLVRVLASMVTYAMRLTWGKDDVVNDGIFEYLVRKKK